MNEGITRYTARLFSKSIRKGGDIKDDYRVKLSRTNGDAEVDLAEPPECPYADQIRQAVAYTTSSVAFQSLAVTTVQTLRSVLARERHAAEATISLAQGEKLQRMIESIESTIEVIAEVLDAQGSHMLSLSAAEKGPSDDDNSWWFTLAECIEAIETGTKRILSLAAGQPKGSAGRRLSSVVVRLLRDHHHQLLVEADAWIS